MSRCCASFLVGLLVVMAGAAPASAQAGRGEIRGTIFDEARAVLPGVTITVTEENTGASRTVVSTPEGTYAIPTLLPGRYTIRAELAGFQETVQSGLVLNVGQELTINITLRLAGIAEAVTVTGQAPLVESTTNRIGTNITNAEIDSLPSIGRNQLSLMQMVPGLVPNLNPGSFEGGQYNANGQATSANVFLLDGAYNNDDRRGGSQGTQANVTLDTMAEYQVLTHQYAAEYGGGAGVVVNAVSRSGTNQYSGRVFEYFKHHKLDATEYFNKLEGEEDPPYRSHVFGGSLGGPFVRNRAFFFGNVERTLREDAANIRFPSEAAPLAVSYSDTQDFTVLNSFLRSDIHLNGNHHLSLRWLRAAELTEKDELVGSILTPSAWRHENDSGDQVFSVSWTSVLGTRATNELKFAHVRENLLQGPNWAFDENWKFIGLAGRDQFDIGPQNTHPDYVAGTNSVLNADPLRAYTIDNAFTYVLSGWGGDHTFKIGGGWSRNGTTPADSRLPRTVGANSVGTYSFPTNAPFDPANPRTYPWRFQIRVLGQLHFEERDWRTNFYVQDKWQINRYVTLNVGVRYDYQDIVPQTKDAFAPRLGVAWDPTGSGRTVVRGGAGKFYSLQGVGVMGTLQQQGLISPVFIFDTQQIASPAATGQIGTHVCLQPVGNGGLAFISPACRAFLEGLRAQVNAGGFVNREPILDGDRRMPYIWAFSVGIKRQMTQDLAVSLDYVGNRGYHQATLLDINVGPTNPATGRITRPGVDGFDPDGTLIPAHARGTSFVRVQRYFSDDRFNTDFNSLEVALEKRMSARWSGRVAYTLARARDVGTSITDQLAPRVDYSRANFDNRHALAMGATIDVWRGLSAGFVFRAYSGYPINETIGSDVNGDGNNNDRPVAGVHDLTRPILSPLDANGRAIRNGIDGEKQVLLDARFQYLWRLQERYQAGLFLEIYNFTNQVNFANPTGNRSSANFMRAIRAGDPRSMQLGVRLTF